MEGLAPIRSHAFGGALVLVSLSLALVGVSALVTLSALNATEYDSRSKKDFGANRVAVSFVDRA